MPDVPTPGPWSSDILDDLEGLMSEESNSEMEERMPWDHIKAAIIEIKRLRKENV